jgi:hypothetical protein
MGKKRKTPAIKVTYRGNAFHPLSPSWASQFYDEGQQYFVKVEKERYWPGHQAFMAFIREAWQSLPESRRKEFPNEDFLRYRLLIAAGYSERRMFICRDKPEAIRMADMVDQLFPPTEEDRYRLVSIVGSDNAPEEFAVLMVERPLSQAMDAMDSDTFWQSVEAVENHLATMFGITRETIAKWKQSKSGGS